MEKVIVAVLLILAVGYLAVRCRKSIGSGGCGSGCGCGKKDKLTKIGN